MVFTQRTFNINILVVLLKSIHKLSVPLDPDDGSAFRAEARKRVMTVIEPCQYRTPPPTSHDRSHDQSCDTVIYPLVQMGPLNIDTDSRVMEEFFRWVPSDSLVHLASGYFNLTTHYREVVVANSRASYDILTAAPEVSNTLLVSLIVFSIAFAKFNLKFHSESSVSVYISRKSL